LSGFTFSLNIDIKHHLCLHCMLLPLGFKQSGVSADSVEVRSS